MKSTISAKRVGMTLFGVILAAISVGFFKTANFGVDPFQSLAMGLWSKIGMWTGYGTFYLLLNLVILIVDLILDRHYIGLATFINMFLVGYIVDASTQVLKILVPQPGIVTRIIFMVIGIVVMCFASAFYYTSDLGVSTYDAIPLFLAQKGIGKFRYIRIISDMICVAVGFGCGVTIGVGTVVTAFFMGPLIDVFNVYCAQPFLKGTAKRNS